MSSLASSASDAGTTTTQPVEFDHAIIYVNKIKVWITTTHSTAGTTCTATELQIAITTTTACYYYLSCMVGKSR